MSKQYTWEELAQHNCEETGVWVAVHDKVYDITKFLNTHPGGKEFLLLAAGRDITDLFISYHPFTDKPEKALKMYEIGTLTTRQFPRFSPDTGFYKKCSERVKQYFQDNKLSYKDPIPGAWRMTLLFIFWLIMYMCQITPLLDNIIVPAGEGFANTFMWWFSHILTGCALGWATVMFQLHIFHDSSHSAWGPNENWWKFGGRAFCETIVGSSMTSWHNQHVIGHHIYTGIFSVDPDVPVTSDGDMRLIVPQQNAKWWYKYQHIYLFALYCFYALKSRIQDFQIFSSRKNGAIPVNPLTTVEWARLISSKIFHLTLRVVIPTFAVGFGRSLALYFITSLVEGGYLVFNFQVSHVSSFAQVPAARAIPASKSFPVNDQIKGPHDTIMFNTKTTLAEGAAEKESNKHCRNSLGVTEATQEELVWDLEWAHLQVRTSVDYAWDSPFCTWMCGALNYQTIHHLFPSVGQYHYPQIGPIIKEVAKEFGIEYNYVPTFAKAFEGHAGYLKQMGEKGKLVLEIPDA